MSHSAKKRLVLVSNVKCRMCVLTAVLLHCSTAENKMERPERRSRPHATRSTKINEFGGSCELHTERTSVHDDNSTTACNSTTLAVTFRTGNGYKSEFLEEGTEGWVKGRIIGE